MPDSGPALDDLIISETGTLLGAIPGTTREAMTIRLPSGSLMRYSRRSPLTWMLNSLPPTLYWYSLPSTSSMRIDSLLQKGILQAMENSPMGVTQLLFAATSMWPLLSIEISTGMIGGFHDTD